MSPMPAQNPGFLVRIYRFPIVQILLQAALLVGGTVAIRKLAIKPLLEKSFLPDNWAMGIGGLLSLIAMMLLYVLIRRYIGGKSANDVALKPLLGETVLGGVLGIALLSGTIGGIALLGGYTFDGFNDWNLLVLAAGMLPFLAAFEEVVFRGILFRELSDRWGSPLAFGVSALIFAALHFTAGSFHLAGFLSIMIGGLLMCALFVMSGNRLWLPIGFHTTWNFMQVFFGVPLSGGDDFGFFMRSTLSGPDWLTGGRFGPEASVFALALTGGALVWTFRVIARQPRRE